MDDATIAIARCAVGITVGITQRDAIAQYAQENVTAEEWRQFDWINGGRSMNTTVAPVFFVAVNS